jgi:hypothetical protein
VYIDFNSDGQFDEQSELVSATAVISATSGTATLTGITIPANVTIGNTSLLRIVLSETTDANSINACGTYANGETLDLSIKFNTPGKDVGVNALIDPVSGICSKTGQGVTVNVKNFGSNAVSGIGLTARIYDGNTLLNTLTGSYSGSISPGMDVNITTTGVGFNIVSGTTYTIVTETTLTGDLNPLNNALTSTISTSTPPGINQPTRN